MARRFNIEEVLEQVCMNHNLQIQPDNVVKDKENDTEKFLLSRHDVRGVHEKFSSRLLEQTNGC